MSQKRLVLILVGLCLTGLCLLLIAFIAWRSFGPDLVTSGPTVTPTPVPQIERTPVGRTPTAQPTPTRPATADNPEEPAVETPPVPDSEPALPDQIEPPTTEERLLQAELPQRDQRLLAMRLIDGGQTIPEIVRETPVDRQLGDIDTFWVTDNQQTRPRQFQVTATLNHITDHAYWWVQEDFEINENGLKSSAEQFETGTYPTNREFFGSEWTPGVDGDPRVHIFMGDVPGVAGYFSASNEYSNQAEKFSNEREMFFINLRAISPGNDIFDSVLAHEFQHMIHWYQDRNEDTWVNEGLSELASFINGYGSSKFTGAFIDTPDTQLTGWADTPSGAAANYGGSFMFMAYFLQRYGEEMTQALIAEPDNGVAGFDAVLASQGFEERFNDVYADFVVAAFVQNPAINSGVWGFGDLAPGSVVINKLYRNYPQSEQTTVFQYGSDYVELAGFGDVTIEFTGSTQVKVLENQPHSGRFQWYSHRGDDTNTRLTRRVDLSQVDAATLTYWIWHDIEADWDYGYVEISTDNGASWIILETDHTTTENPTGTAYGPGYTGASEGWLEERIDLSPYTGQVIQLRFEYVTDDAVNRPGWAVDDIAIPEIGFYDDAESGPNGWQAEGFVRIDNVLPQRFLAQVVEFRDDGEVRVRSVPLDETNFGRLTVEGIGSAADRAVLIVSGITPVTSQPASYEYRLTLNN